MLVLFRVLGHWCQKADIKGSVPLTFEGVMMKVKGKASSLDIAPLTILDSGALQPRKWLLTGICTAAQAVAAQSPR